MFRTRLGEVGAWYRGLNLGRLDRVPHHPGRLDSAPKIEPVRATCVPARDVMMNELVAFFLSPRMSLIPCLCSRRPHVKGSMPRTRTSKRPLGGKVPSLAWHPWQFPSLGRQAATQILLSPATATDLQTRPRRVIRQRQRSQKRRQS
jgi:hypothetical protein